MTNHRLITLAALCLTLSAASASAQSGAAKMSDMSATVDHGLTWGPAPAIFPKGAQMAVVQGDPGSTSLFTVRLRFPDGYNVAPHTHPTDEHVTVISGTLRVGMGTTVSLTDAMTLKAGGFITAPANQAHFAIASGLTVVQIHAMGPFAMTYVNPADTPKAATDR